MFEDLWEFKSREEEKGFLYKRDRSIYIRKPYTIETIHIDIGIIGDFFSNQTHNLVARVSNPNRDN